MRNIRHSNQTANLRKIRTILKIFPYFCNFIKRMRT